SPPATSSDRSPTSRGRARRRRGGCTRTTSSTCSASGTASWRTASSSSGSRSAGRAPRRLLAAVALRRRLGLANELLEDDDVDRALGGDLRDHTLRARPVEARLPAAEARQQDAPDAVRARLIERGAQRALEAR